MSQSSSAVMLTEDESPEDVECVSTQALDKMDIDTQMRCKQIEHRISSLREALGSLLDNVKREKDLWRKELDETLALGNQIQNYMKNEHNEGCHGQGKCHSAGDCNTTEIDTIANTVLRNDAVAKAQMHMEMEKYQYKLAEVENLCQLEMLKIKSSVHELAPLKLIAKEWVKEKGDLPEIISEKTVEEDELSTDQ